MTMTDLSLSTTSELMSELAKRYSPLVIVGHGPDLNGRPSTIIIRGPTTDMIMTAGLLRWANVLNDNAIRGTIRSDFDIYRG